MEDPFVLEDSGGGFQAFLLATCCSGRNPGQQTQKKIFS